MYWLILSVAIGTLLLCFHHVRKNHIEKEERFRAIADFSYDWESWIGPDGRPLWINPAVERITGYTVEECLAMLDYPLGLVHAEDLEHAAGIVQRARSGSSGSDEIFRIVRRNGETVWISISWQSVFARDGSPKGYRSSIHDISHRRDFERALLETSTHYQTLVETIPYGILECDAHGRVTFANTAYGRMQGVDAELLKGRFLWELVAHPDERVRIRDKFLRVLAAKEKPGTELTRNLDPAGNPIFRHVDWNYVRDKSGDIKGCIGVITDVSERMRVEEALRESEQNYRHLVEFSPVPVFVHREGRFVYVNSAAVKLHAAGVPEDLMGRRLIEFIHPLDKEGYLQRFEVEIEPGDYRADEFRIIRLDGDVLDLESTTMKVNYGGEQAFLTICLDATERKSMIAELLKSEARYRGIVEDQTEFIVRWLPDGTRTFVNKRYCQYKGASPEELIGSNLFKELEESVRSGLREKIRGMTPENPVSTNRHRIILPDGASVWHQWTNRAIFNPGGRMVEVQSVGQDITARKEAEEELQDHSRLLDTILNTIPAPIFYKDEKGIYLGCNHAFEKQIGLPSEKIIGHTVYDVAPRDLADIYQGADNQLMREGGAQYYETQVAFADGTRHDVIFNKAVFYKANGEPGGLVGAMLDITERKNYEDLVLNLVKGVSAQTGENFLRSLVKHLANALGADSALVVEQQRNRPGRATVIAAIAEDVEIDSCEFSLKDTPFEEILKGGDSYNVTSVKESSIRFHPLSGQGIETCVGAPLIDSKGKPMGVLAVLYRKPLDDSVISETLLQIFAARASGELERQRSQQSLRESETRYRQLFEEFQVLLDGISDPLMLLSPQLEVIWSNRSAGSTNGDGGRNLVGRYCYEVWDSRKQACDNCPGRESFLTGSKAGAQVSASDGTVWDIRTFPIIDEEGSVNRVIEMRTDVTEKIKMQKESARTGQLAALGELAAGVAHEINNPITGVINYAQILANKNAAGTREHDISIRIIKEGDRIASIVSNLLSFARKNKTEKRPVHLQEVLADALALTRSQLRKESISLHINLPIDLPALVVCSQQIQQVFLNILSNARYALNRRFPGHDDQKILEISWETLEIGVLRYARITFLDNGCGIPPGIRDKIMNPFFTTKPQGEGTGLGLSISHEIIADHGGKMHIDSVEGLFTKVIIDLPIEQEGN
jgi:PAS domain S-box-containing protein